MAKHAATEHRWVGSTSRLQGVGIGWRPEIAGFVQDQPNLGFSEVVAESLNPDHPLPIMLDRLRRRGVPVVPHGVGLSLGGTDPVDRRRVEHLARCADLLRAPLVSEHIAFVRAPVDGAVIDSGHLLPVPRTREALEVLTRNIRTTMAGLDAPLALETIAAVVDLGGEMSEADFVTELLERTEALLLLDLANLHANERNHGWDAAAFLERLPLERIAYCHVAGGQEHEGYYHDTHGAATSAPVLELVQVLGELSRSRTGRTPAVMLERDGAYPSSAELISELDALAVAAHLPTPTRLT